MSTEHQHPDENAHGKEQETSGTLTRLTHSKDRSIAEWTTLGISSVILLTVVGLITFLSFDKDTQAPVITVEPLLNEVREDASGYYLPVIVRNEGGRTVEEVQILVELDTGSGEPETAELTVVFLAGGEEVRGTSIFEHNPTEGEVTARATSFQEP